MVLVRMFFIDRIIECIDFGKAVVLAVWEVVVTVTERRGQ